MNNLDLLKIRENSIVDNIFKDCIIPGYEKYEEYSGSVVKTKI